MGKTFRRERSDWDDYRSEVNKNKKRRKTLKEFRKKRQEKINEKSIYNREREIPENT